MSMVAPSDDLRSLRGLARVSAGAELSDMRGATSTARLASRARMIVGESLIARTLQRMNVRSGVSKVRRFRSILVAVKTLYASMTVAAPL